MIIKIQTAQEWKRFSMWSMLRNYKKFQNNREVSRSWEAVNQEHKAIMERSGTEFS
jgi:hypothetical protein